MGVKGKVVVFKVAAVVAARRLCRRLVAQSRLKGPPCCSVPRMSVIESDVRMAEQLGILVLAGRRAIE